MNDDEALKRALFGLKLIEARDDPNTFVEAIGTIEGGKRIDQQFPVHREWHDFLSEHDRAILFSHVGSGKSSQVNRFRVLWELGRNPEISIGLFSSTEKLPKKFLTAIKTDIMHNKFLHAVFPQLKPSVRQPLWTQSQIRINRVGMGGEPSVQACGAYGNILGSRLDLIILDDMCDLENTLTPYQRGKLYDWLTMEVFSRRPLDRPVRIWALGHPWHEDDPLMKLAREEGWAVATYPCTNKYTKAPDEEEKITIPEFWTFEKLEQEARELGPRGAGLMLWCRLPPKGSGRIKGAWIDKCLAQGRGLGFVDRWDPNDSPTFTGVDIGGIQEANDLTAIFTATVLPDGSRQVIDIRSGHWSGPEILQELVDVHRRFGSIIYCEDNARQDFLMQFTAEMTTLPLKGHRTGMNKHSLAFGVESIGIELEQGKWIFPCDKDQRPHQEMLLFIDGLLSYSPEEHASDHVMSAWICREAIRKSGVGYGTAVMVPDIDNLLGR